MISEHDQIHPSSGLRRIRQAAVPIPLLPQSRSFSLQLPERRDDRSLSRSPQSPSMSMSEDLNRFPSESLHSFSFAPQSEEVLQSRQNFLKRSIDFIQSKMDHASSPGIAMAQAKLAGNDELQSMMELLSRTNLIGDLYGTQNRGLGLSGPSSSPAHLNQDHNAFDAEFGCMTSESPVNLSDDEASDARDQGTEDDDGDRDDDTNHDDDQY